MSSLRAVSLLVIAGCGAVLKPPEPSRRLDVRMRGESFDSDRGYRFAVLPEAGANVVRLDVRYPVGSIDDPPGKEGLAHLVEHLLFQAQFARGETRTSIGAELAQVAISWNASTHADHTTYEVLAPANQLDALIKLEVDRVALGCAGLTAEIVAREREVVLNELRQRQGATGASLQRKIYEAIYPEGHPYRRVDSIETVEKLQLADVCAFLAGPYRRGHAIVIASGAVEASAVKASAGKHLARLPRRVAKPDDHPPVASPMPGTIRIQADVEEPTLLVTWPLPPRMTPGARLLDLVWPSIPYRLESFAFMFGWGHSSSATILGGPHAPVLAVGITLSSTKKLDDAIDAAKKSAAFALRVLGENRSSQEWIATWEAEVEAMLARWASLGTRNEMFGDFMQYERGNDFLVGRVRELAAAGPADARALAEEWLSPRRARFILIEPTGAPASATSLTYRGGAEEHPVVVDGALADAPLTVPQTTTPLDVVRHQLDNGLRVVMWPHGTAPVVHGRLVVDSGTSHDPARQEGTSLLAGADSVGVDAMVFSRRTLATRVDEAVGYLASELRSPGYGLSDDTKAFLRGRLVQRRAKERRAFDVDRAAAVYGSQHPYARAAMTEDSLEEISRDSVMSWARTHIVARNATLVLAGQFDPELVKKHIDYNADHVTAGSDSQDHEEVPVPRRSYIAGTTTAPMATVELSVQFARGEGIDPDHAKRLVLEQVLGTRIADLRGRHAVTYGLSASYQPRRAGGLWTIGGDVDAGRAGEAATALLEILQEMRADPESYRAAFVLARQKVVESLLATATDASQIANRLAELARFDLAETYYEDLPGQVAGLTLATFHPFVVRELVVSAQVFGAFGNPGPANAAVEAARQVGVPRAEPAPVTR